MPAEKIKTACITGSNRGIGLELTKQLSQRGVHVYALCRHSSIQLDACEHVTIVSEVDVTDVESVKKAVDKIGSDHIDLLINNAGILQRTEIEGMDKGVIQKIKDQFNSNALGPVMVTAMFLSKLNKHSKVAFITSRMGSIEDNTSGSHYGYRMSKAALNAAAKSLAVDLKPRGIPVAILHPGWIKTDMTGHTGNDTPQTAAKELLDRIDQLNLRNTGTFWHAKGEVLPW